MTTLTPTTPAALVEEHVTTQRNGKLLAVFIEAINGRHLVKFCWSGTSGLSPEGAFHTSCGSVEDGKLCAYGGNYDLKSAGHALADCIARKFLAVVWVDVPAGREDEPLPC